MNRTPARAAYRRDAQIFLTYLEATGLDLLAVRRAHEDVFARTRQAAGDTPATLNRWLAVVSTLYACTLDEGRYSSTRLYWCAGRLWTPITPSPPPRARWSPVTLAGPLSLPPGCHDLLTLYG